ncbi:TRAP transporter small permease (plasmid) [Qingshengfaniella alkalisoli]|uniref:TRAP transporter small permease protein n=2 Tax=Qingshengfaniella alkalisoli TaxID=2599296 RepID=A0A5B8IBY4_9RHOB|nr:TRAP transporter small permease [Qingshengfaniella alkalisoli]
MALVFTIIFLNSTRRYLVGQSVPWGEELPIYLTIYGVMLALALGYLNDQHIRFSIFVDLLSERVRQRLYAAVDVLTIVSGLTLAYAGHVFALRRGGLDSSGLKSTADRLANATGITALEWVGKLGTWQYAIAIGGALLAVAALFKLIERIKTMGAN